MKVLILNGSPKGEKSNTLRLTEAFLEGLSENQRVQSEILPLYQMSIKPCLGCFACWSKTPGKCCINDDVAEVIEKILDAEIIIWSFPLYYYGLPSQLKALLDRQLPTVLPYMAARQDGNTDSGSHPPRYDMSGKRFMLISTCGFYTPAGNYDGLNLQFDRVFGKGGYETLYCGEGELFRVPELRKRTDEYLRIVKAAGAEFAAGAISRALKAKLSEPLYPREIFEKMADASWGISDPVGGSPVPAADEALSFTKQMAALYGKAAWNGKDTVLEMCYSDVEKTYQIILGKDGAQVLTEDFLPYTTRIETPLAIWQGIARGELDGQRAMMERLYRVEGDLSLMIHWEDYFGGGTAETEAVPAVNKKTNMALFILPWFSIWVVMPLNLTAGAVSGIVLCALMPFAYLKYKPTVFECISVLTVAMLSVLALFSVSAAILIPGSYLAFGGLWTATVFRRIPLTAYYSMNHYGEDKALSNPLFIRTNRILTACWGALYLITPIWTYFLMVSPLSWLTGGVNSVLPALLGVFTAWFQKWYPAYYAGRP